MKKRRLNWFVKYLLSYLLLAALLLTCIGVPVISNIRSMVEEEILDTAGSALASAVDMFDDWRQTMEEYGRQIKGDPQMGPVTLNSDGYAVRQTVSQLYNMVVYDEIYERIVLVYDEKYFDNQPRVFSSYESSGAQEFFNYQYRYNQWSVQDIYDDMHEIVKPVLRAPEGVTKNRTEPLRCMTYIVPLCATTKSNQRGIMLFLVPVENFVKMISSVNIPAEATLVMTDKDGNPVLSDGDLTPESDFVLPAAGEGDKWHSVDGARCQILQMASGDGEWRFALLMPETAITNALSPRMTSIILILVTGMLVAVGASLALSAYIFRPVRRLSGLARSIENDSGDLHSEFEQIELTMTGLSRTNMDLLSRLNSQRSSLRQHMLQAMCLGRMDQKENFLTLVREDGIFFDEKSLRVIVLQMDKEEQVGMRMDNSMRALTRFGLLKVLRETSKAYHISSIGCESGMETRIIAVLSGCVQDELNLLAALEQVQQVAAEHFDLSLTVGVSDSFSGLEAISSEYRKAVDASEMRFIEGSGRIFMARKRVREALGDEDVRRQFMRLEVRLSGALKEEKYSESIAVLDQYVQAVRERQLSPAEARQQLASLRSSIYQQLSMLGMETRTMEWLNNHQYETMDYMRDAIAAALHELEADRGSVQDMQRSELVDRCVNYMNANLSDSTLTMDGLAEALEVSSGYLSRCFKAQMGVSPWQYFDGMRLRRACSLLKDTPLRIGDILLACGYVDKTNFMRKFKRQYGMTPMEYRRASNASMSEEQTEDIDGEDTLEG